jgi:LacI family transcriptional regulator
VLDAIEQLGYVPNARARAMKTGQIDTIGVVVSNLSNPIYAQMLEPLFAILDNQGKKVTLWSSDTQTNGPALEAITAGTVDGVIFTSVIESSPALHLASEVGSPFVLMHRGLEGMKCDQVTTNNRESGREVADFLIKNGRRRPAILGQDDIASTAHARRAGFIERASEHNVRMQPQDIIIGDFTYEFGLRSGGTLLDRPSMPDVIFCTNDLVAIGVIDAARDRKIRVPEDLWVVGFDDISMASWRSYSLTTVRQPIEEISQRSVDLLLKRIEDPTRPFELVEIPSQLMLRSTTRGAMR